jgi:hypothetical protein
MASNHSSEPLTEAHLGRATVLACTVCANPALLRVAAFGAGGSATIYIRLLPIHDGVIASGCYAKVHSSWRAIHPNDSPRHIFAGPQFLLVQSVFTRHCLGGEHLGQEGPPQSTSDSCPFMMVSLQVGAMGKFTHHGEQFIRTTHRGTYLLVHSFC